MPPARSRGDWSLRLSISASLFRLVVQTRCSDSLFRLVVQTRGSDSWFRLVVQTRCSDSCVFGPQWDEGLESASINGCHVILTIDFAGVRGDGCWLLQRAQVQQRVCRYAKCQLTDAWSIVHASLVTLMGNSPFFHVFFS
jgi:hypothetical protein